MGRFWCQSINGLSYRKIEVIVLCALIPRGFFSFKDLVSRDETWQTKFSQLCQEIHDINTYSHDKNQSKGLLLQSSKLDNCKPATSGIDGGDTRVSGLWAHSLMKHLSQLDNQLRKKGKIKQAT